MMPFLDVLYSTFVLLFLGAYYRGAEGCPCKSCNDVWNQVSKECEEKENCILCNGVYCNAKKKDKMLVRIAFSVSFRFE